jgi:hypothetical protein
MIFSAVDLESDGLAGGKGSDTLFGRAGNDDLLERRPETNLMLGEEARQVRRRPPNSTQR